MTPEQIAALPRPLAFVLPGGGALGTYQVGVLKALTEAGVTPDLLVGVSAGAVNSVLFAWNGGVDGVRRLETMWRNIKRRDLMRLEFGRLAMGLVGRHPSFLDSMHGHRFLKHQLGARRLEHAPTSVAVVATDLATGEGVAITSGDAAQAVLASTAFPGVFPPVHIDGRTFIDGGVVADVPLELTQQLGAASALVLCVPWLAAGPLPKHALDILFRASSLGVEAHGRTVLRRPPPGIEVVEIPAPASSVTTFDVGKSVGMIDEGHRHTAAWLTHG